MDCSGGEDWTRQPWLLRIPSDEQDLGKEQKTVGMGFGNVGPPIKDCCEHTGPVIKRPNGSIVVREDRNYLYIFIVILKFKY